jgi:hypothetical protein
MKLQKKKSYINNFIFLTKFSIFMLDFKAKLSKLFKMLGFQINFEDLILGSVNSIKILL